MVSRYSSGPMLFLSPVAAPLRVSVRGPFRFYDYCAAVGPVFLCSEESVLRPPFWVYSPTGFLFPASETLPEGWGLMASRGVANFVSLSGSFLFSEVIRKSISPSSDYFASRASG